MPFIGLSRGIANKIPGRCVPPLAKRTFFSSNQMSALVGGFLKWTSLNGSPVLTVICQHWWGKGALYSGIPCLEGDFPWAVRSHVRGGWAGPRAEGRSMYGEMQCIMCNAHMGPLPLWTESLTDWQTPLKTETSCIIMSTYRKYWNF